MSEFKDLVKSSGLKYSKIAKILRVSQDTVNSYVCGRIKPPMRAIRIMFEINKSLIQVGNNEKE